MDTTLALIRGIVTLDEQTYRDFLASDNVMKRGFLILLACVFIGTFPVFGQSLINNIRGFTPEAAVAFEDQFMSIMKMTAPGGVIDDDVEAFMEDFVKGMNIGVEIDALPTPLPRPIAGFLNALGSWVTAALRTIGPWMFYGAIVLLFAKLAGGPGVLNPFYGLTALFAVPSLLNLLGFIPFLGAALGLVVLIWGFFVYIRAVQISQDFTAGKAILITVLPVLIVLAIFACITTFGFISLASLVPSTQ